MAKVHLPKQLLPQFFSAHETRRLMELDGSLLASFRARAAAFLLDIFFILLPFIVFFIIMAFDNVNHNFNFTVGPSDGGIITAKTDGHDTAWGKYAVELGVPILYWGLLTYFTNGRTPGKWIAGIRVVSTTHERIRFWQSIERALGYSVSALEAGFGFFQYFISTNRRTTHDRLAETIVVRDPNRKLFRNGFPFRRSQQ
jgi:uncharacterized RDD family membrane protein YckC